MPRFKPGDAVRVVGTEGSIFAGVDGVVDEVRPNRRALTELDAYTVRFSWGEKQVFWSAQLEPAHPKKGPLRNPSLVA